MGAFSTQKRERCTRKILPTPLLTSEKKQFQLHNSQAQTDDEEAQAARIFKKIAGSNTGQNRDIYINETNVITFRLKLELLVDQLSTSR